MNWFDRAKASFHEEAERHPAKADDIGVSAVLAVPRRLNLPKSQARIDAGPGTDHVGRAVYPSAKAKPIPWRKPNKGLVVTPDSWRIGAAQASATDSPSMASGPRRQWPTDWFSDPTSASKDRLEAEHARVQIWKAQDTLKLEHGWTEEECAQLWLFIDLTSAKHQPLNTEDMVVQALEHRADRNRRRVAATVQCCAGCINRKTVVTALGTGCRVVRLHLTTPWREWLDTEYESNQCRHFERRSV